MSMGTLHVASVLQVLGHNCNFDLVHLESGNV